VGFPAGRSGDLTVPSEKDKEGNVAILGESSRDAYRLMRNTKTPYLLSTFQSPKGPRPWNMMILGIRGTHGKSSRPRGFFPFRVKMSKLLTVVRCPSLPQIHARCLTLTYIGSSATISSSELTLFDMMVLSGSFVSIEICLLYIPICR
jgi:hypothetical protein